MTDTAPAWMDNMLACYPYLFKRLCGVEHVVKVLEADDFAAISSSKRKTMPLDGAVYLIFDGFAPTSSNNQGKSETMEIGFSVILTKRNITPKSATGSVGHTITAIAKSLQGFDPADDQGRALTSSPFKQRKPLAIQYEDGFAFFPLRFTAEVAVISDN